MNINSRRALTPLHNQSHNLGLEVALWHQNPSATKAIIVCEEGRVEDEYQLLFTCSTYSAIRNSNDDIIRRGDGLQCQCSH